MSHSSDKKYTVIVCYEDGYRTGSYLVRTRQQVKEFIDRTKVPSYVTSFIIIDVDTGERKVVKG